MKVQQVDDISNRTLVFLITIAIFFSVFGTVSILNSMGVDSMNMITGAQTANQEAQVTVTVGAAVSIVLIEGGNISFGTGTVPAVLSTASGTSNPGGFDSPGGTANSDDFVIENDGNVDVDVTINGSVAADFITTGSSPLYNWTGQSHSAAGDNGCFNTTDDLNHGQGSGLNASGTAFGIPVGTANATVCINLSFVNVNDTLNVTIQLFIPVDTSPATYTDSGVFFIATQVP